MSATTCSNCGAPLPATARFCPECGSRAGAEPAQVRTFGTAPPAGLLGAGAVIGVVAIVMLALQHWIVGAILAALAAVLGAMYGGYVREHGGSRRLALVRTRSRAVVETLTAQAQARRELMALRLDLEQLHGERGARLRELGESVYRGDEAGTDAAKAAVRALDARIAAKEEEMTEVAARTHERVEQVRAESQPTVLLEPPGAPDIPEPYPPDTPEPYPPPDEGTPPTPAPIPEPYPPPDEVDRPS